jgi:ATP-dependent Clp protease ATP-binding subunit ClpE
MRVTYTPHVYSIFKKAKLLCIQYKRNCLDLDILFLAFMQDAGNAVHYAFKRSDIDFNIFYNKSLDVVHKKKACKKLGFQPDKDANLFISTLSLTPEQFKQSYVSPEITLFLFLGFGKLPKALQDLKDHDLELFNLLMQETFLVINDVDDTVNQQEYQEDILEMFDDNEVLSKFTVNLNQQAMNGDFDTIVDFDNKVSEISSILCRNRKPNAILVGSAGCGKTALISKLALDIVNGEAPQMLCDKVILSLNLSSMVAGTQYRGQFEQRLEDFINEAKKFPNLIIFIDEIHTLVGAGGAQGSLEASNILKPALAMGEISCIGATTPREYRVIKNDDALDRRFEKVMVRQPGKKAMKDILPFLVESYEKFHGVKYDKVAIDQILPLCDLYMPHRNYPDKAVDVIDQCGAMAKVAYWELDEQDKEQQKALILLQKSGNDIPELIDQFNIKLDESFAAKIDVVPEVNLEHLELYFKNKKNPVFSMLEELEESLQDCSKEDLRSNIINELKLCEILNYHSLLLFGPNECGKSFCAQRIKEGFDGASVIEINGTELSESFAIHKILGGHAQAESLCEKISNFPNSILIIDNFEKIHENNLSLFTQILKNKKLEDWRGNTVDFSNSFIFAFSTAKENKTMHFSGGDSSSESIPSIGDIAPHFGAKISMNSLTLAEKTSIIDQEVKKLLKKCPQKIKLTLDYSKPIIDNLTKVKTTIREKIYARK